MYIEPNTNIRILHNVPLDNTYEHTIYFDSASAQSSYFAGLAKYDLAKYSYQRVQRGWSRVGIKADSLYDCNYMMFQNTSFGSKWFYAFITSVEYVNNVTSEIHFEIDVMQTWFFDYHFNRTFVAREHIERDLIGSNILPEPVKIGEYVYDQDISGEGSGYKGMDKWATPNYGRTWYDDLAIIIAFCSTEGESNGSIYDGVYGGATLYAFHALQSSKASIDNFLSTHVQQNEAVVGMYMLPAAFVLDGNFTDEQELPSSDLTTATPYYFTFPAASSDMELNGYTPRNKKLYTYPYQFLSIDNSNGNSLVLRYEFFNNYTPVVEVYGTITQPFQMVLRPCNYKETNPNNTTPPPETNNTESLVINNFPLCSWNFDAYAAWTAQNSTSYMMRMGFNTISTVGISGAQMYAGDIKGGTETFAHGVSSLMKTVENYAVADYEASIAADICRGTFNNGGANVAQKKQRFYGGKMSITAQNAACIDDFFDKFGYTTNRIKEPNRNSRPHWNYVQTIGCTIEGSIPADDMSRICSIYDRGITFWKNGSEVGHYELDNRA